MSSEKINHHFESKKDSFPKDSDMEIVLQLASHIDKPCDPNNDPEQREGLRKDYLREAVRMLPRIKNENARQLLKSKIEEYQTDY